MVPLQRQSATIDRVAIESARLPSAPLPPTVAAATFGVAGRADARRGYKRNLLFVRQFAKPRKV